MEYSPYIGHFELIEKLCAGGFGVTFKATKRQWSNNNNINTTNTNHKKRLKQNQKQSRKRKNQQQNEKTCTKNTNVEKLDTYCIKVFSIRESQENEAAQNEVFKEAQREYNIAKSIQSNNVIKILSLSQFTVEPKLLNQFRTTWTYTVSPLYQTDLFNYHALWMSEHQGFDDKMVATIVTQICNGLKAMHDKGFIHTDIKLENVLVKSIHSQQLDASCHDIKNISVCICDLGSVHHMNERIEDHGRTNQFSSPEVLCYIGHLVNAKSDVFSLGCLLFMLCTSVDLFDDDNTYTILALQRHYSISDHMKEVVASRYFHRSGCIKYNMDIEMASKALWYDVLSPYIHKTFIQMIQACLECDNAKRCDINFILDHLKQI
tara:strand:- start:908 stop:2035 length:1128 start_codon:yes stop_codon:yes gene_type:complete